MPEIGRLKKRSEFLRVAARGRKWATPGLVLQAYARERNRQSENQPDSMQSPQDIVRVGFTASRKVGAAVARNRARRRLRAVVAEVLPEAGRAGTDYVVIARAATLGRSYAALTQDLRQALSRVGEAGPAGGGPRKGQAAASKVRKESKGR